MKKRIISLVICHMMIFCSFVTASYAAHIEYIKDGGFENDEAVEKYTSVTGKVKQEGAADADYVYSGEKSLKLTSTEDISDNSTNDYWTYRIGGATGAYNGFKPAAGEIYTASVWIKSTAAATIALKYVSMNVGTNNVVQTLNANEWTEVKLTKEIASVNTGNPFLRIEIREAKANTNIYIDDLSFTRNLNTDGSLNLKYNFTSGEEDDTVGEALTVDPNAESTIKLAWPTRIKAEAVSAIENDYGELKDAVTGTLLIAVYDSEERLTNLNAANAADGAVTIDGLKLDNGYKVKTFLWNFDNIIPITKKITAVQDRIYETGFNNTGNEIFYSNNALLSTEQNGSGESYLKIVQNAGWAGVQTLADLTRLPDNYDYKISFDLKPEHLGAGNTFRLSVRYKSDTVADGEITDDAIEYTESDNGWQRVEFDINRKTGKPLKGSLGYPYQLRMVFNRQSSDYTADKTNEIHIDNLKIEIIDNTEQ